MKGNRMIKKTFLYILTVSILATINVFAQDKEIPKEFTIGVSTKTITETVKSKWTYKAEYPELKFKNDELAAGFNKVAKDIALTQVKEFKKFISEMTDEDWNSKPRDMEYEMVFGFQNEFQNDDLISISFGRYEYTGGAHGNSQTITLNYDLKNDRIIQLSDLFKQNSNYLAVISKNSIEQITEKQGEYADSEWIETGAGAKAENYKNWFITQDGLKFVFDAYQVGPYAAGSFETILPFAKFDYSIVSSLFNKLVSATYIKGNPPNWCRNGHFPSQTSDFKLAKVKEKINFYGDDDGCPIGSNCKNKSYLVKNDEVIIGRTYQNFACSWYQSEKGGETVGWLPLDSLDIKTNKAEKYDWAGDWSYYDNSIKFNPTEKKGNYVVSGNAFWKGVGDNIHIGDIGETAVAPPYGYLEIGSDGDEYECKAEMRRLGRYLIVSDNRQCGGANVTFDGVYTQDNKSVSMNSDICSYGDFYELNAIEEKDIDFRLGSVKTAKNKNAYFIDEKGLRQKSYLIQGDEVIVSKTNSKNACVWYQPKKGKETIGWIPLDNLSFKPSSSIRQSWIGNWEYGEGEIKVIPQKRDGSYKFDGKTFWVGQGEGNVSIGDIEFVDSPIANRLTTKPTEDLADCKVKMQLLGDYLIVSDNTKCGGLNVTFSGIYRKK